MAGVATVIFAVLGILSLPAGGMLSADYEPGVDRPSQLWAARVLVAAGVVFVVVAISMRPNW